MRVIIDTNVLISGLLWGGPPHELLEHARAGTVSIVRSPQLLLELIDVLGRSKFDSILVRSSSSRERSLAQIRQLLTEVIEPPPLPYPVCRDSDDDQVLALAIAAKVDLIISGDNDLLVMRAFEGIEIVAPTQALARIS